MPKLTLQTAFNKIVAHFEKMPGPSAAPKPGATYNQCLYRTLDGNRCFVGALIPNRLYRKAFENRSISSLLGGSTPVPKLQELFSEIPPASLSSLQTIHDNWDSAKQSKSHVRTYLRDFAESHNLSYQEPQA